MNTICTVIINRWCSRRKSYCDTQFPTFWCSQKCPDTFCARRMCIGASLFGATTPIPSSLGANFVTVRTLLASPKLMAMQVASSICSHSAYRTAESGTQSVGGAKVEGAQAIFQRRRAAYAIHLVDR